MSRVGHREWGRNTSDQGETIQRSTSDQMIAKRKYLELQ
jgi:hypothetical protein